jgi:cytidylate kinase
MTCLPTSGTDRHREAAFARQVGNPIVLMPNSHPSIIAIDGPAASGKSTLGRRLAESLGYLFFDTGVMYRALTWQALKNGLDVRDEAAVTALANEIAIDVRPASDLDGRLCDVLVNGLDITWESRSEAVDANVSIVAAYRGVRLAMGEQQRQIGRRGRVVMVGRDIGTVILPEADLKIFLDAPANERARRRYEELKARGIETNLKDVLSIVQERDRIDSTRDVAPLRAAPDAVLIDSERPTTEEVFEQVRRLCE